MHDELILCPKCEDPRRFMRVRKRVSNSELSQNDMEEIYVICCENCGCPIAAYPTSND